MIENSEPFEDVTRGDYTARVFHGETGFRASIMQEEDELLSRKGATSEDAIARLDMAILEFAELVAGVH